MNLISLAVTLTSSTLFHNSSDAITFVSVTEDRWCRYVVELKVVLKNFLAFGHSHTQWQKQTIVGPL